MRFDAWEWPVVAMAVAIALSLAMYGLGREHARVVHVIAPATGMTDARPAAGMPAQQRGERGRYVVLAGEGEHD